MAVDIRPVREAPFKAARRANLASEYQPIRRLRTPERRRLCHRLLRLHCLRHERRIATVDRLHL